MFEDVQGLLSWMQDFAVFTLQSLMPHTNSTLEKIMHFLLGFEIPGMPLVPTGCNKFTAIQKARLEEVGNRICFVPDHHLEGVKYAIKSFMIFSNQIVTGENEQISCGLQYTYKLGS